MQWLYEHAADNSSRFVLGTAGLSPLVCIGLNPSTAEPNKLDDTVTRVQKVALSNGHDSFIMLNVYPKRDTYPDDLPGGYDPALKADNERWISTTVAGRALPVYAAWGGIVTRRAYLAPLLRDILDLPALTNVQWLSRGDLVDGRHPRHPLYVAYREPFRDFDTNVYRGVLDTMTRYTHGSN